MCFCSKTGTPSMKDIRQLLQMTNKEINTGHDIVVDSIIVLVQRGLIANEQKWEDRKMARRQR